MAPKLTLEDSKFRELVKELDGNQFAIAEVLGIGPRSVWARLHTNKHFQWWMTYKAQRSQQRRRKRANKFYARRKERHLEEKKAAEERAKGDPALLLIKDMLDEL